MQQIFRFSIASVLIGSLLLPLPASAQGFGFGALIQELQERVAKLVEFFSAEDKEVIQQSPKQSSPATSSKPASSAELKASAEELQQKTNRLVVLLERENERLGPDITERNCIGFYGDVLTLGMATPEVTLVQSFLYQAGYLHSTSSDFDIPTERAVQAFQKQEHLVFEGAPETTGFGQIGPQTRLVLAKQCRERFLNPTIETWEGICATAEPCGEIRPNTSNSGRIPFFNELPEVDLGDYVRVEGFRSTEKRTYRAAQDVRVLDYEVLSSPLELPQDSDTDITYEWDGARGLFRLNLTMPDCRPYQVYARLTDGSDVVIETNEGVGIWECIRQDGDEVQVSRYFEYIPESYGSVHGIGVHRSTRDFVSE